MLIIREAFYGVTRFDDLQADLRAPRGVLSARLKELVQQGILDQQPYREGRARIRHDYRLTPKGRGLGLALIALMEWGDRHLQDGPPPLQMIRRSSGEPLQLAMIDRLGRAVPSDDITYRVSDYAARV